MGYARKALVSLNRGAETQHRCARGGSQFDDCASGGGNVVRCPSRDLRFGRGEAICDVPAGSENLQVKPPVREG
jgi:hypothetical protein